jgi:hypothetical protein
MQSTRINLPAVALADVSPPQLGWRVREWSRAVSCSRWQVYDMIREGTLAASRIGRMTIITESPASFLARHRVRQ